jgi:hypothetical protein
MMPVININFTISSKVVTSCRYSFWADLRLRNNDLMEDSANVKIPIQSGVMGGEILSEINCQ